MWAIRLKEDSLKLKLITTAVVLLATLSVSAYAAPVYLECTTHNKHSDKTTNYKLTLNEDAQTVIFTDDRFTHGSSYTRPAQFAQTDVKFNWKIPYNQLLPDVDWTFYFRVDRTNLEFSASFEGDPAKTDYGSCKIADPVKRQF
jgi:hypothetical protein